MVYILCSDLWRSDYSVLDDSPYTSSYLNYPSQYSCKIRPFSLSLAVFEGDDDFVANTRSTSRLTSNPPFAVTLNVSSGDEFGYPDIGQESTYSRQLNNIHSSGAHTSRSNELRSSRFDDDMGLNSLPLDKSYDSHTPTYLSYRNQMNPVFEDHRRYSIGDSLHSPSPNVPYIPYTNKTRYSPTVSTPNRSGPYQGNALYSEPEYHADCESYRSHVPLTEPTRYAYDVYLQPSTPHHESAGRVYDPGESHFDTIADKYTVPPHEEDTSRIRSRSQFSGINDPDTLRMLEEQSRISYPVYDYEIPFGYIPEPITIHDEQRVNHPIFTVNTHLDDPHMFPDIVDYPPDYSTYPTYPISSSPRFHSLTTTPRSKKSGESYGYIRDPDRTRYTSLSVSPRSYNHPSTPHSYGVRTPTGRMSDPFMSLTRLFLWRQSPYKEIWEEGNFAKQIASTPRYLFPRNGDQDWIHSRIEEAVIAKKECHFRVARSIFIQLLVMNPSDPQIWLEFARLEMECGEYENARHILAASLIQIPSHEALLQKSLKVEERLFNLPAILCLVSELRKLDTQKSMKIMMDGVLMLARMGYEKSAFEYYIAVTNNPRFFTGNFYMEFMEFQLHSGSYESLLQIIPRALYRFPKYGPLWFFCLEMLQHKCFIEWNKCTSHIDSHDLDCVVKEALRCLTNDITWKVYFIRIQYDLRSLLAIHQNERIYVVL